MNTPIYQIFYIKNSVAANQAWKALSEADRSKLMEQERASRAEAKCKEIVICNSAWADEEHPAWGVFSFPDLAARIQHTRTLQKIGWLDLVDDARRRHPEAGDPGALVSACPELLNRDALLRFYSSERLMSDDARQGWIPPDRASRIVVAQQSKLSAAGLPESERI